MVEGSYKVKPLVVHSDLPLIMAKLAFSQIGQSVGLERRNYDLNGMKTKDEVHLVWGMKYRPKIYKELAKQKNLWFMENGWFSQSTGFTIDPMGANGLSSLLHSQLPRDPTVSDEMIDSYTKDLHKRMKTHKDITNERDYIFIPLQVERDTQLLYWSECPARHPNRLQWFVEQVCRAFPNERLIFRPHPRDKDTGERISQSCGAFRGHKSSTLESGGNTYQWIKHARAVISINSTVLLEALTFLTVPILAFGTGLFTGNGIFLEAKGDTGRLKEIFSYSIPVERRRWFLSILMQRHIPYKMDFNGDTSFYPELNALIKMTKEI